MSALKTRILEDIKTAMRAREKQQLEALRMVSAAIKQREVDERTELDDAAVVSVLEKMLKQRRDSLSQFETAGREDLAAQERFEIEVLCAYMPEQLTTTELETLIDAAVTATNASGMREMGKVMAHLAPQVRGRADMATVSAILKTRLGA